MHARAFSLAVGLDTLARIFAVGLLAGALASSLVADEVPVGDLRRPEAHDRLMMEIAAARGVEDDDDSDPDGGAGTTGRQRETRFEADSAGDLMDEFGLGDSLEPEPAGEAREVVYQEVGGEGTRGYLVTPDEWLPGRPAVVVIHEWWGLNEQVREETRKLAGAGYMALAVDLYRGRSATEAKGALGLMKEARGDLDAARANLLAALRYLRARGAGKVGSLGWCMGGGYSLQLALAAGSELDAAVMYYGHTVTDPERLRPLRAPLLGLFAELDEGITPSVPRFREVLDELAKPHAITVYAGAGHAFANPNHTKNHNADYARDAWEKTMSFFRTFLVQED